MTNKPSYSAIQTYKRLLSSLRPHLLLLFFGMIATMAGSLLDAALTWSVKPIVNEGFLGRNMMFIKLLPAAVIVIFVFRSLVNFASSYSLARVARIIVMEFRQKIFKQLLRLPASFYDRHTSGQLLSTLIYNVEQIAEASSDALLAFAQEGFLVIGLVTVMLVLSWQLSLMFVIIAPVISWVLKRNSHRLRKQSTNVQDSMGDITHVAEETIEGYKVIRTFGGEAYEENKFVKVTNLNRNRELKLVVTNSLGSAVLQIALSIPTALVLYLMTSSVFNITPGSFVAFIAAMISIRRPLRQLSRLNIVIQKGVAAAASIFALLDEPVEQDKGARTLQHAKGKIEYRNVSFYYPNSQRPALENINFIVNPGEIVALVGRSGSGKSSLVNLLPRFYDINIGQILVDDVNVFDFRLADLRKQFSFVSQNVTLFNDTVAHNIGYGDFDKVSRAQIVAAAEAANAMEFIEHLPQGLDSIIGENGVLLSGGQRQRIAIARALLKNAPFLILDEATSSLDTESENQIQQALAKLMKNRTTLVIAHRLSTIENADRIIVMDQARIIESGTHNELLALEGNYARLHSLQFSDREENECVVG